MNNRRLDDFTGTIEQYVAYLEAQVLKFRAILVGQGHNLSSPPLSPVLLLLDEDPLVSHASLRSLYIII